jgi:hypothetical protein
MAFRDFSYVPLLHVQMGFIDIPVLAVPLAPDGANPDAMSKSFQQLFKVHRT